MGALKHHCTGLHPPQPACRLLRCKWRGGNGAPCQSPSSAEQTPLLSGKEGGELSCFGVGFNSSAPALRIEWFSPPGLSLSLQVSLKFPGPPFLHLPHSFQGYFCVFVCCSTLSYKLCHGDGARPCPWDLGHEVQPCRTLGRREAVAACVSEVPLPQLGSLGQECLCRASSSSPCHGQCGV